MLVANGATFQLAREREVMGLLLHVRRTPDRLLHPLRRRKALEALRARPRPKSVLVLCHGNICRSPIAAALLARELAPYGSAVQSAGFAGINRPPPAEAVAAAERHQVNLSDHRSRLVTADLIRATDLIVVMDANQRRLVCERFGRRPSDVVVLGDLDSAVVETRTIRDPVNESQDVFAQVYERIARCVQELGRVLGGAAG
jgi:protein-tyrosine-phosphatase